MFLDDNPQVLLLSEDFNDGMWYYSSYKAASYACRLEKACVSNYRVAFRAIESTVFVRR